MNHERPKDVESAKTLRRANEGERTNGPERASGMTPLQKMAEILGKVRSSQPKVTLCEAQQQAARFMKAAKNSASRD